MMAELWKSALRITYTQNSKIKKPTINQLKDHALFSAIIWSEQKKVDKLFFVKQQTNLVKTWKGGD